MAYSDEGLMHEMASALSLCPFGAQPRDKPPETPVSDTNRCD